MVKQFRVTPEAKNPKRPSPSIAHRSSSLRTTELNIGATVGRPGDVESQLDTLRRLVALIEKAEGPGASDRD
jgi:hypothetical protein